MAGTRNCSFFFFKYSLILLNVFFLLVGIILIAVAGAAKASAKFTSISILGGIVACGVLLLFVAIIGLVGAIKHHQVVLFFYMIALLIMFIILFAVSIAVLSLSEAQRHKILQASWDLSSNQTRAEVQAEFNCCGFDDVSRNATNPGHPNCTGPATDKYKVPQCGSETRPDCHHVFPGDTAHCCSSCYAVWEQSIEKLARSSGGVGLAFSFFVIGGLVFTYYYRNRKDPSVNPRAFL